MKVCMVAYAQYCHDARIKAYVQSLSRSGVSVDLLMVREPGKGGSERIGENRIFYQTNQYRGDNPLQYAWSYFKFFLATVVRLSLLGLKERYTAVHVHNMPNVLVFAAIVPKLLGAKIVLDVHDLMPANYLAKFGGSSSRPMFKALIIEQWVSAVMADHVICADHLQKQFLESECGIPADKLVAILNLPNEDIFRRVPRTESGGRFRLVYHGTIARRLGIDIMLRAVAKASKEVPVHLSVYGSGDFLPDALRLSEELQLPDHVYFSKSFFPVEKIPEIVGGMDAGIIANRRTLACERYMLPVKLLEYVYLGIPVIAPRLEIIQKYFDETMLRFYEPEDVDELARAIVALCRSDEERRRLTRSAATFYQKFSWQRQADEYVRLIAGSAATASGRVVQTGARRV
jgi:glycosyltransferase involved in cell wall biosynthesis